MAKAVKEKKEITAFGQKIKSGGDDVGEIDIATLDELIEIKASYSVVKHDQILKYTNQGHEYFLNAYSKKVILFIDQPVWGRYF